MPRRVIRKGFNSRSRAVLTESVKILVRTANSDSPFQHTKTIRVKVTGKEWSIFKILRKEHVQLHPSFLHQSYLQDLHCSRMSQLTETTFYYFLRVADILINLLILKLRRMDGIVKCTHLDKTKATYVAKYKSFVHDTCKIPFKFYVSEESHTL